MFSNLRSTMKDENEIQKSNTYLKHQKYSYYL
jgi:hypothetical protein